MDFRLVADSCCEPVPALAQGIDFVSVPLSMTIGEEVWQDDGTLNITRFLRRMNESKTRAMSSCPPPQAYADAYQTAESKPIFAVTLSAQLSGSYSSAATAIQLTDRENTHVIDSKSASAGEILLALKVRELAQEYSDPADVVWAAEAFREQMQTLFVLENLENLQKSGRMSKIAARLATVMQIRPILGADGEGNIAAFAKARGTRAAVDRLCDMIGERGGERKHTLVITHCNNEPEAQRLAEMARVRYAFREIIVARTGGISSMYANQGGIIAAF